MKAIARDVYGPADVFELRDIDKPPISDDEVLVEVRAAGVDPGVWIFMTGRPMAVRLAVGLRRPKVAVLGRAKPVNLTFEQAASITARRESRRSPSDCRLVLASDPRFSSLRPSYWPWGWLAVIALPQWYGHPPRIGGHP